MRITYEYIENRKYSWQRKYLVWFIKELLNRGQAEYLFDARMIDC